MKNIINTIKKELTLKIDPVNNEFEIGWIWIIFYVIPILYGLFRPLFIQLINMTHV